MVKISTPLQGLIFSKSRVHGYGRLGTDDKIIENLNNKIVWSEVVMFGGFNDQKLKKGYNFYLNSKPSD